MDKTKDVCIYGAGRHGKVIMDLLTVIPEMELKLFIDDNYNGKYEYCGYSVIDFETYIKKFKDIYKSIFIAVSNNIIRKKIFDKCKSYGCDFPNLIHPSVIMSNSVKLGEGLQILPGAIINVGVRIGNNSIIHSRTIIDHDCILGENVSIWPGAVLTGGVFIGDNSYIGANASLIPDVQIGKNTVIGAGAVVINNIQDDATAVGVPAIIIKVNKSN